MQILFNIAFTGSVIALIALGFAVIYKTVHFFHFAHGIVFTAGAYFVLLFKLWLGWPLLLSILLAIVVCAILGCLIEVLFYHCLRCKNSSSLIFLLTSLGIYIFLQNAVSIFFGDETRSIRSETVQEGFNVFGVRMTLIQIVTIFVSIVLVTVVSMFLKKTKIGSAMRAVANDPVLASVSGVNSNIVILWTFAIGSSLAGLAGVLVALDVDMTPTMGMNALMMGVVAVFIGGVNSIPGIVLGALLLATAQHLGAWYIGSQWQDAIAFVVLVSFLVFKPEGFFGKKVKSATV